VFRPLDELERAASLVAAGDLSARADVSSPREFKELADTFNGMVAGLSDSYNQLLELNKSLESTIEERTLALSVEHEKLSSIFKSIPDGVIFISVSGEIMDVNPMMEEIWGVKAEELKSALVEELPDGPIRNSLVFDCASEKQCKRCWEVHRCEKKECPAYMSEDIRCWLVSGTYCRKGVQVSVKRKMEAICSDCEYYKETLSRCSEAREMDILGRHYKISGALVLDKNNKVSGEIKTFYDITEDKLLERRKADFISLITHDLKSPLTNIIVYSELLKDKGLGAEETEFAGSIARNGKKLLDMVEQYLDLTRMEAGLLELKTEQVDSSDLINEAVDDIQVQADNKEITIEKVLPSEAVVVEADRDRLSRVLTNLLSNAIKYSPNGALVKVSARETAEGQEKFLEIKVSDTGYGIGAKELPHVFERYYRSSDSSGVRGTGLGLSVVKSLVDAHKGSVTVESTLHEGTAFKVTIPIGTTN
jgi:PAS domain S-box-containing protein